MIGAESALSTFPAEMNKVTGRVDALDKKVTAAQKAAAAKPATSPTPAVAELGTHREAERAVLPHFRRGMKTTPRRSKLCARNYRTRARKRRSSLQPSDRKSRATRCRTSQAFALPST